jgi:hypothetical protein
MLLLLLLLLVAHSQLLLFVGENWWLCERRTSQCGERASKI